MASVAAFLHPMDQGCFLLCSQTKNQARPMYGDCLQHIGKPMGRLNQAERKNKKNAEMMKKLSDRHEKAQLG